MAGRKTPKPETTSAEVPETIPDEAEVQKIPAPDAETPVDPPESTMPKTDEPEPDSPSEAEPEDPVEPVDMEEPVSPPEPDPATETAGIPTQPEPAAIRRGPGFVPLFLGGVIAAALGFGVGQYVNKGWPFAATTDATAALKADLAKQQQAIAALQQKLDQTTQTATSAAAQVGQMQDNLGKQIDDQKKTLTSGIQTNSLAISALKTGLSNVKSGGGSGGSLPQAAQTEIHSLDQRVSKLETDVQKRLEAAQKSADEEKAKAAASAKLASDRAAVTEIEAALSAGGGYAPAISTLRSNGVDVPEDLAGTAQNGVPTLAALQQAFDPAARDALTASVRGKVDGGVWDRVTAFLQVQTGARSLTPRQGDGPDAVLSRARAAVEKGDLSAAIETIKALPDPGQQAMSDWVQQAQTRLKAQAASKQIGAALANQPNDK